MTNTKNKSYNSDKQHRTPLLQRPWMLVLIGVVIIVIVVLVVVFAKPHTEEERSEPTTTEPEQSEPKQPEAEDKPQEPDQKDEDRPDDKVVQFEGEDPNDLEEITGVVTYRAVENGKLIIDTSIDQYLTSGGTCTVTIKGQNTGHVETATKQAHADITASYCETFEIPAANLPSDYYDIEITVLSNDKKGTIKDGVQL